MGVHQIADDVYLIEQHFDMPGEGPRQVNAYLLRLPRHRPLTRPGHPPGVGAGARVAGASAGRAAVSLPAR